MEGGSRVVRTRKNRKNGNKNKGGAAAAGKSSRSLSLYRFTYPHHLPINLLLSFFLVAELTSFAFPSRSILAVATDSAPVAAATATAAATAATGAGFSALSLAAALSGDVTPGNAPTADSSL